MCLSVAAGGVGHVRRSVDSAIYKKQSEQTQQASLNTTTHHLQYSHLHHALLKVGQLVLDHLDSDNLLCLGVSALDHLSKRA